MMYHVCSPAFMCAYQSVCLCSNNVSRKKRMWEVNPPNGWSGLHLYRMLLCSYFLNSSFALPCPCFFSCTVSFTILTVQSFLPLFLSAIAPDFSQNLLKAQTLARQGGDVLIECKPRMSPRGVISWRKGKEALRESHRYWTFFCGAVSTVCMGLLFSLSALPVLSCNVIYK